MANEKIKLNVLGAPKDAEIKYFQKGDGVIMVKNNLPYETVFEMIQWSINFIMDDRPFVSAPLKEIIEDLALIKFYTNIDLAEIEVIGFSASELYADYDILKDSGIIEDVEGFINKEQLAFYKRTLDATLKSLVEYRNSAAGLLERIHTLASNQSAQIENITEILDNPQEMAQIKKMFELMDLGQINPSVKNAPTIQE